MMHHPSISFKHNICYSLTNLLKYKLTRMELRTKKHVFHCILNKNINQSLRSPHTRCTYKIENTKIEENANCLHVCFCMMSVMLKSPWLIWINQWHKSQGPNNVFYQFVGWKWFVSTIMSYNKELYDKKGKRITKHKQKFWPSS